MILITSFIGHLKILLFKLKAFLQKTCTRKRQRKCDEKSTLEYDECFTSDTYSRTETKQEKDNDLFPAHYQNYDSMQNLEKPYTHNISHNTKNNQIIGIDLTVSIFPEIDYSQFDPNSENYISILPCSRT